MNCEQEQYRTKSALSVVLKLARLVGVGLAYARPGAIARSLMHDSSVQLHVNAGQRSCTASHITDLELDLSSIQYPKLAY